MEEKKGNEPLRAPSLPVRRAMDGEVGQCLLFCLLLDTIPQSFLAGRPTAYSALPCRPGMSECGGGGPLFLRPVSRAYTFVDLPEPWPVTLGTQEDYTAL